MPKSGAPKVKFSIGKSLSSESLNSPSDLQMLNNSAASTHMSNTTASVALDPRSKEDPKTSSPQHQIKTQIESSAQNQQNSSLISSTSSSMSSVDRSPPELASFKVTETQSSSIIAARRLSRKLSEQKDVPTISSPEEFVQKFGGNRIIKLVLIANNGIAAVKCMRSIRRWSYEVFRNERAIKFVVMYTPEDLKANAEYIRMGDLCVPVPGGSNNNNYANCDLILDIGRVCWATPTIFTPKKMLFLRDTWSNTQKI